MKPLVYKGDCSKFDPHQVFGPKRGTNDRFTIDTAVYDREKNQTTITFKPYVGGYYGSRGAVGNAGQIPKGS